MTNELKQCVEELLIRIEELLAYKRKELTELEAWCDQRIADSFGLQEPWCFKGETIERWKQENLIPLQELVSRTNKLFDEEIR